ncbi:hypothetical protein [African swine fever virus]|nr:BA71V-X69R [African swine fever virus]
MLLLYTVMILTCIFYKLAPDKYWPIHMFFMIMIYIGYMYEKLDIHEKSQFWNDTMARLSGRPVPALMCKCFY